MFNTRNIVTGLISAAALMIGANAQAGSMPFMPRGGGVGAPMGFAELCRRDAVTCGLPPSQLALMGLDVKTDQAATSSIGASSSFRSPSSQGDAALDEPNLVQTTAPAGGLGAEDGARVAVDRNHVATVAATDAWRARNEREQLKLLNQINQAVNREVKKASDLDMYGQPEYWSLPRLIDGKLYGDCEDYALEKRRQLIAAGVPESSLSIAVAVTARGEGHAVLMISLKSGDWVLDNLTPWATPWEDLNYRWVQRQVPGTALWTSAA